MKRALTLTLEDAEVIELIRILPVPSGSLPWAKPLGQAQGAPSGRSLAIRPGMDDDEAAYWSDKGESPPSHTSPLSRA